MSNDRPTIEERAERLTQQYFANAGWKERSYLAAILIPEIRAVDEAARADERKEILRSVKAEDTEGYGCAGSTGDDGWGYRDAASLKESVIEDIEARGKKKGGDDGD